MTTSPPLPPKKLLILDGDQVWRERLARGMMKRGYEVEVSETLASARTAISIASSAPINAAILELKLSDGNGLELIDLLHRHNPHIRTIILTGYANIATAVFAMKKGALDYLPKPVDAQKLHTILTQDANSPIIIHSDAFSPMSPDRIRWEHIQRVYTECQFNMSETARQLKMHRRTLQRILSKHAPL